MKVLQDRHHIPEFIFTEINVTSGASEEEHIACPLLDCFLPEVQVEVLHDGERKSVPDG